jgi:hypothetical protein
VVAVEEEEEEIVLLVEEKQYCPKGCLTAPVSLVKMSRMAIESQSDGSELVKSYLALAPALVVVVVVVVVVDAVCDVRTRRRRAMILPTKVWHRRPRMFDHALSLPHFYLPPCHRHSK